MADEHGGQKQKYRRPGDSEMHRQRRRRNLAILAALGGIMLLFYLITIVRVGGG